MKESIFHYELFRLGPDDIARLQASDSADDLTTLGLWHIITATYDDYVSKAETLFRKAIAKGSSVAKLQLANMYRLNQRPSLQKENKPTTASLTLLLFLTADQPNGTCM